MAKCWSLGRGGIWFGPERLGGIFLDAIIEFFFLEFGHGVIIFGWNFATTASSHSLDVFLTLVQMQTEITPDPKAALLFLRAVFLNTAWTFAPPSQLGSFDPQGKF